MQLKFETQNREIDESNVTRHLYKGVLPSNNQNIPGRRQNVPIAQRGELSIAQDCATASSPARLGMHSGIALNITTFPTSCDYPFLPRTMPSGTPGTARIGECYYTTGIVHRSTNALVG